MRRGVIYFLTLCLLACLVTVTAPEAKAAESHTHCVCGGHAKGIGDHVCDENVIWEPWDGTTELEDGHSYYLNDTDGDGVITLSATQNLDGKQVNLCLNGVELTSSSRVFLLRGVKDKTTGLSICDCSPESSWGCISSTNNEIAPVLHSYTSNRADVTINLYSGNLIAKDNDASTASDAGVLRLGNNTGNTGAAANHKGTFNMYGGTISGGQTQKAGGNIYISIDCYFNMYGGTVSGGTASKTGGNFHVAGHLNLQGGLITGGSAGDMGGGIYLAPETKYGGTLTVGGNVQALGNIASNVYLPSGKTIEIGTLAKSARIGVTPVTTSFATTANESDARYFFSDNGKYEVLWSDGVLKLGSHKHCVCGGSAAGIGEHSCQDISWTSLTAALAAKGMTPDTADFGKLAAGRYFLDCDLTVTGATNLTKDISLCLNGYSVYREDGKLFGYLKNEHALNICDCSGEQVDSVWQWKGSMNGGTNTYGSVIYTHYGSTLNIYGGNFTGKGTGNGGVIVIANDGIPDLDGDGDKDNDDKALAEPSVMNFYNGAIYGSQTASRSSTVTSYHTAAINWYGGQLYGGLVGGVQDAAVIMEGNHLIAGSYTTLKAAIAKATNGQCIRLISDVEESITVSGTVYLDLNGYDLSGITVDGTLYAFDSAGGGVLRCTGTPVLQHTYNGISYMALPDAGSWSFHHGSAQITKISLKPNCVGMGYKAQFEADEAIAQAVSSYGYQLWLDGYPIHTFSTGDFVSGKELTLRLQNILSESNEMHINVANSDIQVNARAFIRLNDGTMIKSEAVSYDLQQMLELADTHYSTFTDAQKTALQTMYSTYESLLLGWDMPNIIHADGSWTEVDAAGFKALLTDSGKTFTLNGKTEPYFYIKAGKYILTEDVDLSTSTTDAETGSTVRTTPTIHVKVNERVSICLNGHTLSTDSRMFRVYGTLDICDCSTHDGTLTSSFAGNNAAYAPIAYIYSGTMNIYGGNICATGTVSSAGVLAVGKSGSILGTLNIFGGTVSGGHATDNGGLISLFDTSTVNMYGGILTGGRADGSSGGIAIGVSAHANLYGGLICSNHAGVNGGGMQIGSGQTQVYLGSRLTVRDNTAGGYGGNIYNRSEIAITIDGATITGGSANMGGGIYTADHALILQGDAVIRDNTDGNLYVSANTPLDTTGLTQDADVHIYNPSAMLLNQIVGWEKLTWERSGYKTATIGSQAVLIPESFTLPTDVEGFQVGFGRADITPTELGMPLAGYGNASERLSKSIDQEAPLTVTTVAITDEEGETVLLMSVDLIRPSGDLMDTILPAVSAATGVPEGNIFTTFTHTHSVPETKSTTDPKIQRYNAMLPDRFAESANLAMADRKAATMETGSFEVGDYGKQLNFTRHYQYQDKNGVWQYFGDNFGTSTINATTKHVTEADHTMHLVKFTREGKDIVMANWRVHPHMTGGGTKYVVSADIIGTTQKYFEQKSGMHFIYLQGAAGNNNETSKLSSEKHGYDYKEYGEDLSNQIVAALLDGCLEETEIGLWQVDNYSYTATADIPTEAEYQHAKNARDTYNAWLAENPNATSTQKRAKCEELGYLTWFHFNNVITRHSLNETYQLPLNTFSLGSSLAFFTAPGELWDTVSMEIEDASPFDMTLCIGYSQDHYNYFVYDPTNGGEMIYESYESNNYRFVAPNTINDMIAYWKATLDELYANLEN